MEILTNSPLTNLFIFKSIQNAIQCLICNITLIYIMLYDRIISEINTVYISIFEIYMNFYIFIFS